MRRRHEANADHAFDLKRPCANCPFRREGAIELRPGRIEGIVADLLADDHAWFHCHKDAHGRRPAGRMCTGALVYLLKVRQPNLAMRAGAAFGLLSFDALREQFDDVIDPLTTTTQGTPCPAESSARMAQRNRCRTRCRTPRSAD